MQLLDEPLGLNAQATTVTLDLGLRYLFGGEATYLRQDPIRHEHDQVVLEVGRTQTDVLIPKLGLTFTM